VNNPDEPIENEFLIGGNERRAIVLMDYDPNWTVRDDVAGEMAHLQLTRERWTSSGWPEQVAVSGVEECMVFFGLG